MSQLWSRILRIGQPEWHTVPFSGSGTSFRLEVTVTSRLSTPLAPKNRRKLLVLFVCRISTVHQDIRSLADQEALCREWLTQHTDLETEIVVIAGRGSGEDLQRTDYQRACDEVASGRYDLVLVEDLGRICRRIHALLFCEECQDHETRLVAINDGIDTVTDGWRMSFFRLRQARNKQCRYFQADSTHLEKSIPARWRRTVCDCRIHQARWNEV